MINITYEEIVKKIKENIKEKEKNKPIVHTMSEVVGQGYNDFWNFKGRYRVCKGSRASKKSKTTALNFIVRLLEYPEANLLVVRKVYNTLKDSCYTELCWAIKRLDLEKYFTCKTSPLEITYNVTGQRIYFRGLDDPLKITSITVDTGCLCWMWLEEAYEINDENDFNMLDESIRGSVPENLFKQITITLNPWNERHWIKSRFFDVTDNDIMAKTTNYMCNEWLDSSDLTVFERMKNTNPRRYQVAGLGNWGITEGLVYENWNELNFNKESIIKNNKVIAVFGLDFGYTNDETALFCGLCDIENKKLYVYDEIYKKGMNNEDIYNEIVKKGYKKERIRADCSEPKSIDRLRLLGLQHIRACRKGKDSINNGIDFIQNYEIIISPKCIGFLKEISNYSWEIDKFGKRTNIPCDKFNHLMDAMRYGMEEIIRGGGFSFD